MGCWAYCRNCGRGLQQSSLDDIDADYHECPSCNFHNPLNRTVMDILRAMQEQVNELQERVDRLENPT